jgi:hypothetical protein
MFAKPWPRQIKCVMLEPTTMEEQRLRRYTTNHGECADIANWGTHQNWVKIGEVEKDGLSDYSNATNQSIRPGQTYPVSFEDGRWPTHCTCGWKFPDEVGKQYFPESLYRVQGTDTLVTLRNAPAGSMWYATWLEESNWPTGPDGRVLIVRLPNGSDWTIDSRASNCTLKEDTVHRCWVRHGTPPEINVDKNGHTCQAGGGSISSREGKPDYYHGFLRNGFLEEC